MNNLTLNEKRIQDFTLKMKKCLFAFILFILAAVIIFRAVFPGDFHLNFEKMEISYETWVRYKPYNLGNMTQEQKELYARDYMLDEYGVEVNTEYKTPTGTPFSRLYPFVLISPIDSNDAFEFYHIFFKGNGKICDDYYLSEIQDFVTQKVEQDIADLPYDCVVITHTYNYSPYFPTYRMKWFAKNYPLEFLKLKKTYTMISYIFSTDYVGQKDKLSKMLEEKTSYMNADGNLFFVDGDIHQYDLSSLKPEMLLAFY